LRSIKSLVVWLNLSRIKYTIIYIYLYVVRIHRREGIIYDWGLYPLYRVFFSKLNFCIYISLIIKRQSRNEGGGRREEQRGGGEESLEGGRKSSKFGHVSYRSYARFANATSCFGSRGGKGFDTKRGSGTQLAGACPLYSDTSIRDREARGSQTQFRFSFPSFRSGALARGSRGP
jgi:hypothetical protein